MHVRAALRIGLTPDEIKEVLLHSAIYCGVPAANGAFAVAQRVLDEVGRPAELMRTQVGIVGAGPAGTDALPPAAPRRHRVGRARGPQPRVRRAARSRRRARAGHGRPARRGRRRRAAAARGDRPPRHRAPVRRRAPPHRRSASSPAAGRSSIYGQTRDREGPHRRAAGRRRLPLLFEVERRRRARSRDRARRVRFRHDGAEHELECDFIAGCDGFHGVCRPAIPAGVLARVRARVPVRLARHPRRGPAVERRARLRASRARLRAAQHALARAQPPVPPVPPGRGPRRVARRADLGGAAAAARTDGWTLAEGPMLEKGVTAMRSYVAEPMRYGRLFLAGDAAHIVPPTGAKGLNLALADVRAPRRGARRLLPTGSRRCSTATRPACAASGGPSTSPGG